MQHITRMANERKRHFVSRSQIHRQVTCLILEQRSCCFQFLSPQKAPAGLLSSVLGCTSDQWPFVSALLYFARESAGAEFRLLPATLPPWVLYLWSASWHGVRL